MHRESTRGLGPPPPNPNRVHCEHAPTIEPSETHPVPAGRHECHRRPVLQIRRFVRVPSGWLSPQTHQVQVSHDPGSEKNWCVLNAPARTRKKRTPHIYRSPAACGCSGLFPGLQTQCMPLQRPGGLIQWMSDAPKEGPRHGAEGRVPHPSVFVVRWHVILLPFRRPNGRRHISSTYLEFGEDLFRSPHTSLRCCSAICIASRIFDFRVFKSCSARFFFVWGCRLLVPVPTRVPLGLASDGHEACSYGHSSCTYC
mmetsp:Transcript_850/g.1454  ORF Transcript_850/g.1454 Transcript_850/m.1454 type:complete len:255 (-) Transcript_850:1094-1858(-)